MANPISDIKKIVIDEETKQANDLNEINTALADNKEAVLAAITLMRHLHETGLLAILNGMLARGEDVLDIAVKEINKPENADVLANGIGLAMQLGTLDVDRLKILTEKLNNGVHEATSKEAEEGPSNVFQLMKLLKDPEINQSIALLANFLRGIGKK